jgi:crotonobetainyl-CoA:carnitine CoA-transferase CaiB-like acyl-CoA transferase
LFLAAVGEQQAVKAASALGISISDDDPTREHAIAATVAELTVVEAVERLHAAGVAASVVSTETIDHWLESRHLLTPAHHPGFGDHYLLPRKVDFPSRVAGEQSSCVVGEHTVPLLVELGWSPDDIGRLIDSGAAAAPQRASAE